MSGHVGEHAVAPVPRRPRVAEGRVGVGRRDDAGQQRGLRHAQRLDRGVEVPARRLGRAGHAVRAALPPVDRVQVHLEDLVLGQQRLEPDGQQRLGQLAAPGALVAQEEPARQLLRDRAGALAHAAGLHVGRQRPQAAAQVEAEVPAEAPVLRGHDRLAQAARDARQRHPGTQHPVRVGEQGHRHRLQPRRPCAVSGGACPASPPRRRTAASRPPASRRRTRSGPPEPAGSGAAAKPRSTISKPPGTAAYSPGAAGERGLAVAAGLEVGAQVALGQGAPGIEAHAVGEDARGERPRRPRGAPGVEGVHADGEVHEADDRAQHQQGQGGGVGGAERPGAHQRPEAGERLGQGSHAAGPACPLGGRARPPGGGWRPAGRAARRQTSRWGAPAHAGGCFMDGNLPCPAPSFSSAPGPPAGPKSMGERGCGRVAPVAAPAGRPGSAREGPAPGARGQGAKPANPGAQ